jgi:nucleoside-diphosphate-sugar epimerase
VLASRPTLVTGASGFIGGRLAETLLARGEPLRLATTNPARLRARFGEAVEVVAAELGDQGSLRRAVEGCSTVFHAAHVFGSARAQRVNIDGSRALAEAAAEAGSRFVYFSSAAAYGPPRDGELDEDAALGSENDPYVRTKRSIEEMLLELCATRGPAVSILQPTIVYGPRGGFWTRRIIEQVKARRVVLPARGRGLCNAVYVEDVVSAALLAAASEAAVGERFLVSGAEPTTWLEFYGAFVAITAGYGVLPLDDAAFDAEVGRRYGSTRLMQKLRRRLERIGVRAASPEATYLPDPAHRARFAATIRVNIGKARSLLGYAPAYDLARGMAATAEWVRGAGHS